MLSYNSTYTRSITNSPCTPPAPCTLDFISHSGTSPMHICILLCNALQHQPEAIAIGPMHMHCTPQQAHACQRRWGISQCPSGATGPTEWRRTDLCTASGGIEADESVSVEKLNLNTTPWRHGIGVSPSNGAFLHGNYKLLWSSDKRNTPYFKSMSVCLECNRPKHFRSLQQT